MGTISTSELQKHIKNIISKLGWSQNRLAREIYTETHDYDDEDEIKRFEGKLKKDLNRNTIKPELLEGYLEVISQHREFESINIFIPRYIASGKLSDSMESGMEKISKSISELIV